MLQKSLDLEPDLASARLYLALALAGEAQHILMALERRPPGNTAFAIALVHLGLGDNEQALRWLQAAYEERSEWLPFLAPSPIFDPLRPDPRFSALMRKVGIE